MEIFQGNIVLALLPALALALAFAAPAWFVLKRTELGPSIALSVFLAEAAIICGFFTYILFTGLLA